MTDDVAALSAPVLVADDDVGSRTLVALALRRAGLEVIEADSGQAALEVLASQPVAIAVFDVSMPGMSGIELVAELRRRPETATLPILLMTGSGDEQTVIEGLDAGADDFVPKPVRLDELVARVKAHIRTQTVWSRLFEDELRARAGVVSALSQLTISSDPEAAAEAVVRELSARTDCDFVSVLQVASGDRLEELAAYNRRDGIHRGGRSLPGELAQYLLERGRKGPWVEQVGPTTGRTATFRDANLELAAVGSIHSQDELVGLLTLGIGHRAEGTSPARQAGLLAAAIDYASVLSAVTGATIADRRRVEGRTQQLREVLAGREFYPVFQPIVDLETRSLEGFEALTRFNDGSAPATRFTDAHALGLGHDFELATLEAAIEAAPGLPSNAFLSVNVSPSLILEEGRRLGQQLKRSDRTLVLEVTEHVAIDDYSAFRSALERLPGVGLAVDDAGAGYSSLRHILELRPMFAKLDLSLVRGIDGDELRQALAAGLDYFALRTGCRLIAEGVETEGEAAVLKQLGIEFGQGYLFGRPAAAG